MFEFLFKRPGEVKPGDPPAGQAAQPAPTAALAGSQRAAQAERLSQIQGDEAAAVEFILQCEFSELRLAAAAQVHGAAGLERVYAAMRNSDRRVAKLVHGRLDALRHHEAERQRGAAAIAQAEALLHETLLTPNQVAELDRAWSVIAAPELADAFAAVRARLAARLEAQVSLQRAMIDRLAALRALAGAGLDADALAARIAALAQEQDAALASPEQASLPKGLINEFAAERERLAGSVAEIAAAQAAVAAREAALAGWEAADPASLQPEQLRREWARLPAVQSAVALQALQQRFDAVLASVPAPVPVTPPPARPSAPAKAAAPRGADGQFLDNLDALEAALAQGALGSATELDKALKDARDKGMRLTPAQAERLAHARAEYKRLSAWARWSGNVSREELIKAVEALPAQQLSMSELARKVGSMRERWKTLDSLSGAAPRSLWEHFDAACSAAYAPAAAHFRQMAEERHANAARAAALVGEAQAEVGRLQEGGADWRHVAGTVQRLRSAWSHLGAIDRKEKKRLDQQFADALNVLQAPLAEQRQAELTQREALIDEVAALDPHDRHVIDAMKAIQQRWQEHARALPLERKLEQALWQRFRAACDAVFQARKDSVHAADAERRSHAAVKEAICARLEEAASGVTPATAIPLLREAAADWHAAGPVPRALEARLDKRYHDAVALVQHQADTLRRVAGLALASAVRDKLRLVQGLEAALAGDADDATLAGFDERWRALPSVGPEYERVLGPRFAAALAAIGPGRADYARLLDENRPRLLRELLRLEIIAGVDSGAEFARDRLQLQVEVLQTSLKSGRKPASTADALRQLCALPALADARTASRIEHLLMRLAREGK